MSRAGYPAWSLVTAWAVVVASGLQTAVFRIVQEALTNSSVTVRGPVSPDTGC